MRHRGTPTEQAAHAIARAAREHAELEDLTAHGAEARGASHSVGDVADLVDALPGMAYRRVGASDWRFEYVSAGCRELTGHDPDELTRPDGGSFRELVHPDDREPAAREVEAAVSAGRPYGVAYRLRTATGEQRWVWDAGRAVPAADGRMVLQGFLADITEREALVSQVAQAQKMEAMGRLAGSIAHDFNNMLVVILSYAGLALREIPPTNPVRELVAEMDNAARRASSLTRQLLAFGRREAAEPHVVDLNTLIREAEKVLKRSVGEQVTLRTALAESPATIRVAGPQLEQILVNLALNGRDAMPRGGELRVETSYASVDASEARRHVGLASGRYVVLTVSDTGTGMTEDVAARAFEPFFTTKGQGLGSGLGLAVTYAAVQQAGGHIALDTALGRGTTVRIYLPAVDPEPAAPLQAARPASDTSWGGAETVLVVEDEDIVRGLVKRLLARNGYSVMEARSGSEALALAAHLGRIDLLLTDLVMPLMSGRELAARLAESRPALRVLFMSGYTHEVVAEHGIEAGIEFVEKPFDEAELLAKVRGLLDTVR